LERQWTKEELDIFVKASRDIFFFSSLAKIIHPIDGKIPFLLYPFQKRVLWEFLNNRFNIILKARQMGLTELIGLFVLWVALFGVNKNIVIISLKDRVAKRFLRRIKHIYMNLPEVLQVPIINGRKGEYGNAQEMIFSNGSIITSIPTTEDAGRSEAVTFLIMDETAIMKYAEVIWAAAAGTLFTGGGAILNSTPFGIGNFYHKTWVDSLTGSNGFNPIQIPWHLHPDRDQHWYMANKAMLGSRRAAQEIDCDFLTSGDTVFDLTDIKAIQDSLMDYPIIEKRYNGALLRFKEPDPDKEFFLGGDVATGRARDYSTFTIMDKEGEEYVCFKGRVPLNKFKDIVGEEGMKYNQAKIAIETNDIGEAVTSGLQEQSYPNMFYTQRLLTKKGDTEPEIQRIPGWYTTSKNRPIMIDGLERDIREDVVTIKDPFFISEAYTFIYDESNRPVAMNKGEYFGDGDNSYSDDAIIGKCITNWIRKGRNNTITTLPR
jgi:hypothetical protein